jgi:hypothetical protein
MLTDCLPLICNPTEPSTPFGTWWLSIADAIRVASVIAAIWLLGRIGAAWRRSFPHGGQRDRYASLALFAFVAIGTELNDLGDIPSYQLVLSTAAVVLAIRGLRRFDTEQPSPPKTG